ncbi:hypothetical protein MSG28_012255, partial [Choristoneura fumiferana]
MDTTLIAVDIKADDFSKACTNGIFLVVWVVVTFQYGVVLTFKDQLKTLIRINQENFDAAESMPEEDQALIREYAYRARWVTKVWCFSCCLNCALFPIKSLVLTLYSLYIDDFRLVPWYDCSFPSVIEEINYVQLINDVFKVLYEISLKASAIMLPITLYQVIDMKIFKPGTSKLKKARYVGIQATQFNTYVTLKLQNVKSTTVTVKGPTPCWEQDFLFETNDINLGLLVEVWNKGVIWDRALGYHYLPLTSVAYNEQDSVCGRWVELEAQLMMRGGAV